MRIGLLYDTKEDYVDNADSMDYIDFSSVEGINLLKNTLMQLGHNVTTISATDDVNETVRLARSVELVFNNSEGFLSRNREGLMPALLEIIGKKYIGSDAYAASVTLNKIHTKIIAHHLNITTPRWLEVYGSKIIEDFPLKWPRIIKPNSEGNSAGIRILYNMSEQESAIKSLSAIYDELIIEEFISGREITVPVVGNGADARVPMIIETLTKDGKPIELYSVKEKLCDDNVKVKAILAPDVENTIKQVSLSLYRYLGCRDYGRLDFKLDDKGVPYFLEINLIPSLEYKSSFFCCGELLNIGFKGMIEMIIDTAKKRKT